MSKNNTQEKRVLDYMIANHGITRRDAMFEIGVANLTAVVAELRKKGHNILTKKVNGINRYEEKITYAKYIYLGKTKEENKDD